MKKNKPILNILVYIIGLIYFSVIIEKLVSNTNVFLYTVLSILKYLILIGLLYFFNKDEINKMLKAFKKNGFVYLKKTIWIWLIGFLLMLAANYLIEYFGFSIPSNEEVVRLQIKNFLVYSIIATCFLGPILEEITFRLSFNEINNKYFYLIVTSLLFAVFHINGLNELIYLIPYTILGLTYGITYIRTNNIFTSIIIHMIHNIVTFILLIIL